MLPQSVETWYGPLMITGDIRELHMYVISVYYIIICIIAI